jgi:hypothetical protein
MGATCSSETSVEFQRTTRRYIPEDWTLITENSTLQAAGKAILMRTGQL